MTSEFEDVVQDVDAPRVAETMSISGRTWVRYENETTVGWVEVGKFEEGKNG